MKLTKTKAQSKAGRLAAAVVLTLALALPLMTAVPARAESKWLDKVKGGLSQVGEIAYDQKDQPKDIRQITANIINIFLGLLGTIFVLMVVIAGYNWMTAAGNEDKIAKAKKTMATGILGLLIVLAAFAVTIFITSRILFAVKQNPADQPSEDIKGNPPEIFLR